jgi:hypothetical protein
MIIKGTVKNDATAELFIDENKFDFNSNNKTETFLAVKEKLSEVAISANRVLYANIYYDNSLKKLKITPDGKVKKVRQSKLKPQAFVVITAFLIASIFGIISLVNGKENTDTDYNPLNSTAGISYDFDTFTDTTPTDVTLTDLLLTEQSPTDTQSDNLNKLLISQSDIPVTNEKSDNKEDNKEDKKTKKNAKAKKNFKKKSVTKSENKAKQYYYTKKKDKKPKMVLIY